MKHQQLLADEVREWIDQADRVVFLTGAGVSAESGIQTFRQAHDGIWKQYSPLDLATKEAFLKNPEHVLAWYAERRAKIELCEPNNAHLAIADLQSRKTVTVVTQNVDGLHQRAGSQSVIELHGNIISESCLDCGATDHETPHDMPPYLRYCAFCGGCLRPNVVWFGESLPEQAFSTAVDTMRQADLLFIVGTSGEVYPAAKLPEYVDKKCCRIVLINPDATPHAQMADAFFGGKASELLPQLLGEYA